MLAEDEEVKRVGREARRKDGRMRRAAQQNMKTETKRPRCAPRRKEVKQWRVREEVERSKKTRIPFEQLTGLVLSLFLSSPFSLSFSLPSSLSTFEDLQITRR